MNTDQKSILRYLSAQTAAALADAILTGCSIGHESGYHALAALESCGLVRLAVHPASIRPGRRGWELTDAGREHVAARMAGNVVVTRTQKRDEVPE